MESYASGIEHDGIRYFSPEMRREIYDALQLSVIVASDGTARFKGVADVQVIRLTRAAEDYGHEVAEYRDKLRVGGKLSSSKNSATLMSTMVSEEIKR